MGRGNAWYSQYRLQKEVNHSAVVDLMYFVAGNAAPARISRKTGHYKVYSSYFDGTRVDTEMP